MLVISGRDRKVLLNYFLEVKKGSTGSCWFLVVKIERFYWTLLVLSGKSSTRPYWFLVAKVQLAGGTTSLYGLVWITSGLCFHRPIAFLTVSRGKSQFHYGGI